MQNIWPQKFLNENGESLRLTLKGSWKVLRDMIGVKKCNPCLDVFICLNKKLLLTINSAKYSKRFDALLRRLGRVINLL